MNQKDLLELADIQSKNKLNLEMTKYSEERMYPEEPTDMPLEFVYLWLKQYEEHVARYKFFAHYARNNYILDAGCGFGYGSVILGGYQAKKVIGIDKSIQTLRYAAEKYNSNNIYYAASDLTCAPFVNYTFDTIYAFEVVEHIKNDDAFLSEMARLLKEDGYIFISTPNKKLSGYEDGSKKNQFHFREYELNEFRNLLGTYFSNVQIYGERYSQRYRISECNLNSIRAMKDKIIYLDTQIDILNTKINNTENKFSISKLVKKIRKRLFKRNLNEFDTNQGNKSSIKLSKYPQSEELISIPPCEQDIIISSENLENALYFIGVCKK
jgi:2-polyprenyl-3-methyl-5-hydroxy-6-metoxy-1,4-benzoquinol methylase